MTQIGKRLGVRAAARWIALAVLALAVSPAAAQVCPSCILNSAAPQNAQVNIGTAAVRGTITASTATVTWLNATNVNIANLMGNGSSLTNLSAAQLTGTVPSGAISGIYSGITGVGTLTAGVWQGTAVGTQYGGTGQNFSTTGAGAVPYFSGTGTMSALASPGSSGVMTTNGSGAAPFWTNAPPLVGTNLSAIPPTALAAGTLPTNVAVQDGSLSTVSAAKVVGNISGGAATLTTPLPLNNLAGGILSTAVAASSITATGVAPGTYGGPTQIPQFHVGTDGRLTSVAQFNPPFVSTTGALPGGVTVDPIQMSSGTLPTNVVASSVAATGTPSGAFGDVAKTLSVIVQPDGRLSSIAQQNIALPLAQLNSGTLPGNIAVPAASIQAGSLGNQVMASSVAASGVAPGTYGTYGFLPQITVGTDGRLTSATQLVMPSLSTATATTVRDNNWISPQTFQSSITVNANALVNGTLTATSFSGNGPNLFNLTPANMAVGTLPANVIASSVAVNTVGTPQLQALGVTAAKIANNTITNSQVASGAFSNITSVGASGVTAGSYGAAAHSLTATVGADGRVTAISEQPIAIAPTQVNAGSLPSNVIVSSIAVQSINNSNQIVNGTVIGANLANNTLTNTQMAAGTFSNVSIPAANVNAGTMGASVIASSVAATGVANGSYGSASQSLSATVGVDGRLSAISANSIAIAASQVTSGQLAIARGGTNLSSAGGTANRVLTTTDGSTFGMNQIVGPEIAASTIPANALNQSGASDGQVLAWSNANSQWQPANAGVTASGLVAGVVPVATGSNALGAGNGFITSVSSGVAISTNVTLGGSGSTVIIQGLSNTELFLSSQAFTTASAFTVNVAAPVSSATVKCMLNSMWVGSAGHPTTIFNSDTATNYYNSSVGQTQSVGVTSMAESGATAFQFPRTDLLVGLPFSLRMEWLNANGFRTTGTYQVAYENSATQWESQSGSFQYDPAGFPKTMTFTASAGTMTGFIRCTYSAY